MEPNNTRQNNLKKLSNFTFRTPLSEAEKKAKLEAWRAERKTKLANRIVNPGNATKSKPNVTIKNVSRTLPKPTPSTSTATITTAKAAKKENLPPKPKTVASKTLSTVPRNILAPKNAPKANPPAKPTSQAAQAPAVKPRLTRQAPVIKQTKTSQRRLNIATAGVTSFWNPAQRQKEQFQKAYQTLKQNPQLNITAKDDQNQTGERKTEALNAKRDTKRRSEAFVVEISPVKAQSPILKPPTLSQSFRTPQTKKPAMKYAFGTGCASLQRAEWKTPKEPSQTEKIAKWMESKGRNTHGCTHLSCMTGSQAKNTDRPVRFNSIRKNFSQISNVLVDMKDDLTSPKLKKHTSEEVEELETSPVNTTYDKDEILESNHDVTEVEVHSAATLAFYTPMKPQVAQETFKTVPTTEVEEVDVEPEKESEESPNPCGIDGKGKENVYENGADGSDFTLEHLLAEIMTGFKQGQSPDVIQVWLNKTDTTFPDARRQASFWVAKSYLAEHYHGPEVAIDVYEEAMKVQAEPFNVLHEAFENLYERVGQLSINVSQTPLLKKLAKKFRGQTPKHRNSHIGLDAQNIIKESVIKYELRVETIYNYLQRLETGKRAKTPRKSVPVPLSSLSDVKLVATPVRRSLRTRKSQMRSNCVFLDDVNEELSVVDSIDELEPALREKLVFRENKALGSLH